MTSLPYRQNLNNELYARRTPAAPVAVDMFAGCGGMGLGFAAMGFRTIGYELNPDACGTYQVNVGDHCFLEMLTPDTKMQAGDILVGGPPCQPFSVTGRKGGASDHRNGVPTFLAAVERTRPTIAVLENVPALATAHKQYFAVLLLRLQRMGYAVDSQILNAADFGVPQNRRRLFVVAHRGGFVFPVPTHVDRHVTVSQALGSMVRRVPASAGLLSTRAMKYVRKYEIKCRCRNSRDLACDRPARTLTCRNLAGATGDMIRLRMPDGRRRRLTVREAARLQSFPDWFRFSGSKTSQFEQIGNAVPPLLAKAVASAVLVCLRPVSVG
jgi:DNA (cytosine-5)-methyltransferase 1